MITNGESVWQAWQRIQRLYQDPENLETFGAARLLANRSTFQANNEVDSQPRQSTSVDSVIETYFEALEDLDPSLKDDLVSNLGIMGRITDKVCTIRFIDTTDDEIGRLRYETAEGVRVISSGLRPSAEMALVLGSSLEPLLEIQVESGVTPPTAYMGARPENIYLYSWRSVRSVVTHG